MALDSDGTTTEINCGSDSSLDNIWAGGGTVMSWINLDGFGASDQGRIADKSSLNPPADGWAFLTFGLGGSDRLRFQHSDGVSAPATWEAPSDSLSTGVWIHVAMTYDKDSQANDPIFYIDGELVTTSEVMGPNGPLESDAAEDYILMQSTQGSRGFDGRQADHRAYDRILSAEEISIIFASRGHDNIVDGLVGRWVMREAGDGQGPGGEDVKDYSDNNNDGTITGTPIYAEDELSIVRS